MPSAENSVVAAGALTADVDKSYPGEKKAPIVRVLLTGGPGAGKSSALATVRDRVSRRGFQAVVIPENATALLDNSGGYDPTWHGSDMHVRLQQLFLQFQMQQEEIFQELAQLRPNKPHLLLHDRGCLDGRLFCTSDQWKQVIDGVGQTEEDLLKRYDLVIHMTTVASGLEKLYDYGEGSSNPARYHTPEQARNADELAQEIYSRHPNVRVVPNFPEFSQKMEAVVGCVTEAVQVDGLAGPRERIVLSGQSDPVEMWQVETEVFDIKVTFLDADLTESVRKREPILLGKNAQALGDRVKLPDVLYEYRQDVIFHGERVNTRRVLTADAYLLLRQRKDSCIREVQKRSICFTWEGNYYEVCSYTNQLGNALPDTCALSGNKVLDRFRGTAIPPWLHDACEDAIEVGSRAAAAASGAAGEQTPQPLAKDVTPFERPEPVPPLRRKLSRNATAEAAASVDALFIPTPVKRLKEELPQLTPAKRFRVQQA